MSVIKLVDKRGNCCGYQAGYIYFENRIPSVPIVLVTTSKKSPAAPEEAIFYWDLRESWQDDQECPYCEAFPNSRFVVMTQTEDAGRRKLVRCKQCEKLFRPYPL